MRLAVWSPLPPSRSGIADYVAESLPGLAARCARLVAVVEEPAAVASPGVPLRRPGDVGEVDLNLYHVGNSPAHAYVYRAALTTPGVVVMHEWSLHHLVLCETVERGDRAAYLREMRRAHGERGSFVGRQVARALGGELLPALYPLNERVLEGALGVVGLTRHVAERARRRLPRRPVLQLPHHLSLPFAEPLPSREEARRSLALPRDELLLTAPGLATRAKGLDVALGALSELKGRWPALRLVVAGGVDPHLPIEEWARAGGAGEALRVTGRLALPEFVLHLIAADLVLALRFPSYGEMSGALVRALGVGRPCLVTASTPAAEEFPDGVVAPIDPGPTQRAELVATLDALLGRRELRRAMERVARDHVRRHHDLDRTADALAAFLESVLGRRQELEGVIATTRVPEGSLRDYLAGELRWTSVELGLGEFDLGVEPLLAELAGKR